MNDLKTRAPDTIEEAAKTADRLARRMGAKFVPDPRISERFQRDSSGVVAEPLPTRS
jgi:hypothetical protein